jgi:putative hydrolase of the HAD superfamily
LTRFRAVIFDLDDTLYPEREYVLSGYQAVANWVGSRFGFNTVEVNQELATLLESGASGNTFDLWLESKGIEREGIVQEMVSAYREHQPTISLFDGTHALLTRLHSVYSLGLLSDGYLEVQERKFGALDLAKVFDAVVFSDSLGREYWKPSPRPYEAVIEKLGVRAHEAVYVADNPTKDFLGARRVGMASIRLRRQGGVYALLEPESPEHSPDLELRDLDGLEESLLSLA